MYSVTNKLSERLLEAKFRIHSGEQLQNPNIQFVASKNIFIFRYFAILSTHVVALEKDSADSKDIEALFNTGYQLGKQINRIPLLRGLQFGYAIIPLIIGQNPDSDLLLLASTSPIVRFSLIGFPVVVDLTENQLAFFEGFQKLGGVAWPVLQKIAIEHIEPPVDELKLNESKACAEKSDDRAR